MSILFALVPLSIFAQQDVLIEKYLDHLENLKKKYFLLVAESMPEDNYEYRVTPESMSFTENLMHIGWAMDWHSKSLLGGLAARDWDAFTELKGGEKSEKEMISSIERTFEETIRFIMDYDVDKLDDA